MKIIKYLFLLLLVVLVGGATYIALQPDGYDVKRSKLIKAPVSVIFNHINELKNWERWSPWVETDSSIKITYSEQTSGIGGAYSWTSSDGPGKIKTIGLEENKYIDQKMYFSDYDPSDVYWTFEETDEGTNVTWGMKNEKKPLVFKVFAALNGGMDNILGPKYEKGLENLDKVVQEELIKNPPKPSFTLGTVVQLKQEAQQFIGYKQVSKINLEAIAKLYTEFKPKAETHAATQKLTDADYTLAGVFTKWDEEKGEAEFYIGLLVNKDIALDKGMEKVTLPAGKNVMITKYGPYGTGDQEAHIAINEYLKNNSLETNGAVWELYVNDPQKVGPEEIETEIHYPVN